MRSNKAVCRAIRRNFFIFTVIALLPLAFVYLVTNDQLYKIKGYQDNSKKTLAERTFRYPLMILRPLKELAKRAAGTSRRSAKKLARLKYYENDTKLQTIPVDTVQTLADNEKEMVEQRMKKRKEHLVKKCSQHGLNKRGNESYHKPNPWEYLVNLKHHLIWCNVFKAASSSWMYNFNILAGYSKDFLKKTNDIALNLARKKYPRVTLVELQEAQNESITFMIVRHPFERLLSAYRDKFVNAIPHSFHDILGYSIVRKYRKNKQNGDNKHLRKYPTFSEFVNWLLDEVLRRNSIDMHLVPASKFCTPCLIKIDIIIKFETLNDDQLYLIEKGGLQNVIMPEWKNSGRGKNTSDLLQQFYSQLTRKQLDGLYEYYKYDFEIFDYNPTPYYNIVKYDDPPPDDNILEQIKT